MKLFSVLSHVCIRGNVNNNDALAKESLISQPV